MKKPTVCKSNFINDKRVRNVGIILLSIWGGGAQLLLVGKHTPMLLADFMGHFVLDLMYFRIIISEQ